MPVKEDLVSRDHEWEQIKNKLTVIQIFMHALLHICGESKNASQILGEVPAGDVKVITQGMMTDNSDKKETTLTKKHYIVTIN